MEGEIRNREEKGRHELMAEIKIYLGCQGAYPRIALMQVCHQPKSAREESLEFQCQRLKITN